jgi:serine/threonine protein kinase
MSPLKINAEWLKQIIGPYLKDKSAIADPAYETLAHFIHKLQENPPAAHYYHKATHQLPFSLRTFDDGDIYLHLKKQGILHDIGAKKKVYIALRLNDGLAFAQLNTHSSQEEDLQSIKEEYRFGQTINSAPRLLGYHHGGPYSGRIKGQDREKIGMYQQLCPNGPLNNLINNYRAKKTTKMKLKIAHDVLQALNYLHHERHIVHRDIKVNNILYNDKEDPAWGLRAYLTDFDLCWEMQRGWPPNVAGTAAYMAYELILACINTRPALQLFIDFYQADIYSLGVTLYYLCEGSPPMLSTLNENIMDNYIETQTFILPGKILRIKQQYQQCYQDLCAQAAFLGPQSNTPADVKPTIAAPSPPSSSVDEAIMQDFYQLVVKMLALDPRQRPSTQEALGTVADLMARR